MAAFYNNGEQKQRPGVYMRITSRGAPIFTAQPQVLPDPTPSAAVMLADATRTLLRTADGYYLAVSGK